MHEGHRERIRQRFSENGLTGFADHEVLELLLTYAIPRVDVNPLAHRLLDHFGSLSAVLEAAPEELMQVDGVGPNAASLIALLLPLYRRYRQDNLKPRLTLNTYGTLTDYCKAMYVGVKEEQAYVLGFDARLRLLGAKRVGTGSPEEVPVLPRRVVQALIQSGAVGAVLTHNHPSGTCAPSQEDIDLTNELFHVLSGMGIRLYDHVIVCGEEIFSFHQAGLLEPSFSEPAALAAQRPQRKLSPRPAGK